MRNDDRRYSVVITDERDVSSAIRTFTDAITLLSCREEKNGKMIRRVLLLLAMLSTVTVKGESRSGFYS